MSVTENGGVRLHWEEQGSGTPILLVMGHRYSSKMWYPAIPALAAEHRLVWFDNRGTGESDTTSKVTVADMAADAWAVADAAGVERAHIYGVSMGGVIVQEMAFQHPERVMSLIVGCSGALTADKPRAPAFVRLLYYLPPSVLKLLTPNRRGDQGYGAATRPDAIAADQAVLAADKFTVRGVIAQADAMAAYSTTREAIAGLSMPALVLHGDEDAVVPFKWGEELAHILPHARFVRIAGAGHNYLVAAPRAANAAVLEFTREVDARSARA
ncbi:MAG TPA: alpha/beta hydrolase [Caulobacteraceae bacterium]|jgi:pimeloyl-ACP methyl ester carboxylesterase|nr:alpha/beta hydrolase [Caulobacteraceae bacterium]